MTAKNRALVIFSGGQDSTTCLLLAIQTYGRENVRALSFNYGQRHHIELEKAKWITRDLGVEHQIIDTTTLTAITTNALMDTTQTIETEQDSSMPNTFVAGRNALFILLAAIHAHEQQIRNIYLGVCETDFSGYPDCRDSFVKSMNVSINLAMDATFRLITPLMDLTKKETWALADDLGYLDYVYQHTHTCYYGVDGGCGECPSCQLREAGYKAYLEEKNHEHK